MTEARRHQPCSNPKCGRPWSEEAFYANCTECKNCKRQRSRDDRAAKARQVAVAERLVEALFDLARRGGLNLTQEAGLT